MANNCICGFVIPFREVYQVVSYSDLAGLGSVRITTTTTNLIGFIDKASLIMSSVVCSRTIHEIHNNGIISRLDGLYRVKLIDGKIGFGRSCAFYDIDDALLYINKKLI